ncbi:hypothetical protein XH99_11590 [Bradyrhizobium nanningense]|uniref:Uncharacterized protein n=1 Tax=Bradyrhizobium nanningense TaxID=1325118 RepID=A0A4V1L2C7_9BRAD|nr:hypothetical protein XH84_20880 [Bradyrhizobium nanningense]RXH30194.1 hypothetical protein XH99_11590 [Bradyrhizobium nanningense]
MGGAKATQAQHEAILSNHTLAVVEDGHLDLDVAKSKDALMRRLRQVSRPASLGGLPSNLPSLVT